MTDWKAVLKVNQDCEIDIFISGTWFEKVRVKLPEKMMYGDSIGLALVETDKAKVWIKLEAIDAIVEAK